MVEQRFLSSLAYIICLSFYFENVRRNIVVTHVASSFGYLCLHLFRICHFGTTNSVSNSHLLNTVDSSSK